MATQKKKVMGPKTKANSKPLSGKAKGKATMKKSKEASARAATSKKRQSTVMTQSGYAAAVSNEKSSKARATKLAKKAVKQTGPKSAAPYKSMAAKKKAMSKKKKK